MGPAARSSVADRWTLEERIRLAVAVEACGQKWKSLARGDGDQRFPGRSSEGLRLQWNRDQRVENFAALVEGYLRQAEEEQTAEAGASPGRGATAAVAADEVDGEEGADLDFFDRPWCGVAGSPVSFRSLPDPEVKARDSAHGRSWRHAITKTIGAARPATERALEAHRRWKLGSLAEGQDLMATSISAGLKKVKDHIRRRSLAVSPYVLELEAKERDALGISIYPRSPLWTLLGGHDAVPWLSGPVVGDARFMTSKELATLLGIKVGARSPYGVARALMRERELWAAVADSIHARFADALVEDGWRRCAEAFGGGRKLRYGGLMGGAVDALYAALVRRATAEGVSVAYAMLAERDAKRAAALLAAERVQAVFCSAAAAAEQWAGQLDVLSFTASCEKHSKQPLQTAERAVLAKAELEADVDAFQEVVRRCEPQLVMIEQSDGLRTHHPALYAWFCVALERMPYNWSHGCVDVARLGASQHRKRLGWVGTWKGWEETED